MPKIVPELVVSHMQQSMAFYNLLGFEKDNEGIVDENGSQWYSLAMGDATVWLLREDVAESLEEGAIRGNGVHLFLSVDDVDATYDAVRKAGLQMNIVKEIETLWYGLREFKLSDPDGYIWTINTPVSQEAAESIDGQG
jgi:uncharacterized glyoxalase superfamily protein PhnB